MAETENYVSYFVHFSDLKTIYTYFITIVLIINLYFILEVDFSIYPPRAYLDPRFLDFQGFLTPYYLDPSFIRHCRV